MKRKILIPIIFIWFFFSIAMCLIVINLAEKTAVKGSYVSGTSIGDNIYCVDRRFSGSNVLKISNGTKVTSSYNANAFEYEDFEYITSGNDTVTVLASRNNPYAEGDGKTYKFFVLSKSLSPRKYSEAFVLPKFETFSSMTCEGDNLYLVTVETDGRGVHLYEFNQKDFTDLTETSDEEQTDSSGSEGTVSDEERIDVENENAESLVSAYTLSSEDDRLFAEGYYSSGTLYAWEDDEEPYEGFLYTTEFRTAYEKADVPVSNLIKRHPMIFYLFAAICLIGAAVLLAFLVLGKTRDIYSFVFARITFLLILLSLCFIFVYHRMDTAVGDREIEILTGLVEDFSKSLYTSSLSSEKEKDFYDSDAYFTVRNSSDISVSDMVLVKVDTSKDSFNGEVVLSKTNHNHAPLDEVYGEGFEKAVKDAYNYGDASEKFSFNGHSYTCSAISLIKEYGIPYIAVGIDEHRMMRGKILYNIIIPFVVVYILVVIVIFIREMAGRSHLRSLAKAMIEVSDESRELTVPSTVPQYLKVHWEALTEIEQRIKRINYSVYCMYQAYYRFAPKKIENILGKESIMEVRSGDAIRFRGTEAILSFSDRFKRTREGIDRMNQLLALLEKHQYANNGVLISSDMGVRRSKMLFVDGIKNTYEFGVHFLSEAQSQWRDDYLPASVILHYSEFDYGVVGTDEQSMTFMDSDESNLLEKFSKWLFDKGVRMVVTDDVVERENIRDNIRYIGFIHEGSIRIKLYECLDVEPANMRMSKIRNLDRYNEALDLFDSQDFYLARNLFSAILRDVPDDAIAKWYLFECEKYLEEPMEKEPLRLVMDDE